MVIKQITSGIVRDKILFEAEKDESVNFGHFLGTKEFWISKGNRVSLKFFKTHTYCVGDTIKLSNLITPNNQLKFNWQWI